jgi:hypothetical protein
MTKLTLAALLLLSTISWAADAKPADYTINVHVSASHLVFASRGVQDLEVTIDSKKYELQTDYVVGYLLALGDYKAKLVIDKHRTTYDSYQDYEFLFPDGKTRIYEVVGHWE